ncbi:hypothetical protein B0H21DRAFT_409128 [Amylocystis lapponica]|nr:hypothetical protein B0H21DRAFT_409128 [Amylocystis lapponica]
MAQAFPQAYAQPNKGTLIPGQTISVNKYTVQVERYLSQGGFAHVYLVRTATPVYNTTRHVLKRIAVPNEAMLTEVKKEVDIMRILKGHPNIVYLIDAAWHRLPNGTYEVFILMEFCAGGGIIDMMNRRLRERLTEQEILTIFVDVCEGLAAMHNLKPPLLHRDLKVENILQASATSYKLCDFGSTTAVQRVPTNSAEIRMLEADLNRHTTLQYRAPEMVDVYLRRPVDEKSDVWALGVLLYKLCYYTTPFEEHGPLAILNVQYKIPPYPVYSTQMNAMIGSMLREHGTQRPSVFEVLAHVHRLRGTKSRFTYTIPTPEPLSPRAVQPPLQARSPNVMSPPQMQVNPMDELVSFKSQQQAIAKNTGVEAREKVLEAIAPMRRGRPTAVNSAAPSPPASPKKDRAFELDMKFGAEEDRAWRGVRGQKSGPSIGTSTAEGTDAWGFGARNEPKRGDRKAFENDFSASFGKGFGDAFDPVKPSAVPLAATPQPAPSPKPLLQPVRVPVSRATGTTSKDAFDGLGLSAPPPPQTLGEARKSRTGLASFGTSSSSSMSPNPPQQYLSGLGSSNTTYRPPSSHSPLPSPSPQPQPHSQTLSPVAPPAQWRPHSKGPSGILAPEDRFPSLEDLDREFASPSVEKGGTPMAHALTQPAARPSSRASYIGNVRGVADGATGASTMDTDTGRSRFDGVRSQHVTGAVMRESKVPRPSALGRSGEQSRDADREPRGAALQGRPSFVRRHRSSVAVVPNARGDPADLLSPGSSEDAAPALPPRPTPSPRTEPRDWLTGADEEASVRSPPPPKPQPVLRDSPSKRASYFERSPIALQKPLEAESVLGSYHTGAELVKSKRDWDNMGKQQEREWKTSKSPGRTKAAVTRTGTGAGPGAGSVGRAQGLTLPTADTTNESRQPSPSGLTENWSPVSHAAELKESPSSSSDDGPEDLNGYARRGGTPEKSERRRRTKGRQSSVHDLVGLWDGGLSADKEKEKDKPTEKESEPLRKSTATRQADKRKSVIMPSSSLKPPTSNAKPRSESPQPLHETPSVARPLAVRPPSSPHRRQPSATPARQASIPAPVPAPSAGRSRPQSMFLTSFSKTSSTTSSAESTASSSTAATSVQQSLALPPDPRTRRAERRSSISDMVQRYEAIGSSKAQASAAAKPSAPDTKLKATADSPSAAAVRFPRLSPTSPVFPRASPGVPASAPEDKTEPRRASPTGLPARTSPLGFSRADAPFGAGRQTETSGLPVRRSPFQADRQPAPAPAPVEDAPHNAPTPPEQGVRSPSPERPYQGVSRLIDRWNRATDDTGPGRRGAASPARRVGVVEAGRGR